MDHYAGDLGQYKVLLIGADSYLILKVKHKKKKVKMRLEPWKKSSLYQE